MIRLTVLLCAGVFLVLLIAGQDRGQVRQGLMNTPEVRVERAAPNPAPVVQEAATTAAVFVPAQPVRLLPEPVVPQVVAQPEPTPEPEPAQSWAYVDARSVNVRAGPSTEEAVIGRLSNGETVLVVALDAPVEGWARVRIEGDGVEGYVAARFLTLQEP